MRRGGASLTTRLVAGALVWMLLLLGAGGFVLATASRQAAIEEFGYRLDSLLRVMAAVAEAAPDGSVTLTRSLGDPRFDQVFSGWYWQVAEPSGRLIRSRSLWDTTLPVHTAQSEERRKTTGPRGEPLLVAERDLHLPGAQGPIHLLIAGDLGEVNGRIASFNRLLYSAMAVLAAGILIAILIQVRFGLQPLRRMAADLAAIRAGTRTRLGAGYPREVAPLAAAMDAVLDHDSELIERARTHVGNLAHGLKTPLAVLQAELGAQPGQEVARDQLRTMTRLVEHHLARASATAGSGRALGAHCTVRPVAEEIAQVLQRVHTDRPLTVSVEIPEAARFTGPRDDLQEMLGNLMENAWKWARSRVALSATGREGGLVMIVEDDGPGLTAEQAAIVAQRGARLDESVPGWGLGLSIVADLAALHGGSLAIDRSSLSGVRATLSFPADAPPRQG